MTAKQSKVNNPVQSAGIPVQSAGIPIQSAGIPTRSAGKRVTKYEYTENTHK